MLTINLKKKTVKNIKLFYLSFRRFTKNQSIYNIFFGLIINEVLSDSFLINSYPAFLLIFFYSNFLYFKSYPGY